MDTVSGRPIEPSSDGELEVRGPQVMQGYLGQRTATEAILSREGWLRTGDLGHVDADGNVVIVDRIKELIKVKGFQVAPTEIEDALRAHPAVADAAVVGQPDDRDGERPIAFVITCADVSPDELWPSSPPVSPPTRFLPRSPRSNHSPEHLRASSSADRSPEL